MAVRIIEADVRDGLAQLADQSVQCCVTSPPYYGLRDYGVPGQLGLEPTLAEYIETMVGVFRDVRRVLRDDGTLWLNIGDSYSHGGNGARDPILWPKQSRNGNGHRSVHSKSRSGLKPKDLLMVPARLALALQDDGWYLRSDIIWHKPNPMPESCGDRPTSAHEHIFLLSKRARYFYDAEAIRTPPIAPTTKMPDGWDTGDGAHGAYHREGREKGAKADKQRGHSRKHAGFNERWDQMTVAEQRSMGANARNVWTMATRAFPEAHFATFPPELPERCIAAGSRPGDTVLDPFGGSGTTPLVADRMGRNAVVIDINPEYIAMMRRRIEADCPLFVEVA